MFPGKRDNKIKSKCTNVSGTWGKWQTAGILQITAFFNAHQNNFNMNGYILNLSHGTVQVLS